MDEELEKLRKELEEEEEREELEKIKKEQERKKEEENTEEKGKSDKKEKTKEGPKGKNEPGKQNKKEEKPKEKEQEKKPEKEKWEPNKWTRKEREEKIRARHREPKDKAFTLGALFLIVLVMLYIAYSGLMLLANPASGSILLLAIVWFMLIRGAMKGWPKKLLALLLLTGILLIILVSLLFAGSATVGIRQVILMAILAVAFISILGTLVFLHDIIFHEGGD